MLSQRWWVLRILDGVQGSPDVVVLGLQKPGEPATFIREAHGQHLRQGLDQPGSASGGRWGYKAASFSPVGPSWEGSESWAPQTLASAETGVHLSMDPLLWKTSGSSHHLLLSSYPTPSAPRAVPGLQGYLFICSARDCAVPSLFPSPCWVQRSSCSAESYTSLLCWNFLERQVSGGFFYLHVPRQYQLQCPEG